jgi:hypothetical protein
VIVRRGDVPVQVPRQVADDRTLSLAAKGLMVVLESVEKPLSQEDLWAYSTSGEEEINAALLELSDRGHIEVR